MKKHIDLFKELGEEIYQNNLDHGFCSENLGERLMLVTSELSEALEADRNNKRCEVAIRGVNGWTADSDFKSSFENNVKDTFEDEIADAVIRLLDIAIHYKFDLLPHVKAKMRYNKLRPYKHGNKKY